MEKGSLYKFKEIIINSKEIMNILIKKINTYQTDISNNDYEYKRYFEYVISPQIQNLHRESGLFYCAFCSNLKKSYCHNFCFRCSKNYFEECGLILPGTFPFMNNYLDSEGKEIIPWSIISACDKYEGLDETQYFKNFIENNQSITIAFYEAVEGLFLGLSRGKRPCHICASVNIDIYNSCLKSENFDIDKPCSKILGNIIKSY